MLENRSEITTANSEALTLDNFRARLSHNENYYRAKQNPNLAWGTLASTILRRLQNDPAFHEDMRHFVDTRHDDLTASHGVKLVERSFQATVFEMGLNDAGYPHQFDEALWDDTINELYATPEAYERLLYHLFFDEVHTNIADRYKAIKIIAMMYAERFDSKPSYLDIGSSIGQGMKLLAYNRSPLSPTLSFDAMKLGRRLTDEELGWARKKEFTPTFDPRLSRMANTALQGYFQFGSIRGVDKADVYDLRLKKWVRNNHYPGEFVDGVTLPKFDMISELDSDYRRVKMTIADITTKEGIRKLQRESDVEEYDIISCVTMLYQIKDPRVRLEMIRSLAEMVKEGGLIILQDAKKGNFETPYEYTTSIIDTSKGLKEEEVLHWETARCRAAVVGRGVVNISGRKGPFDEALEDLVA